MFCFFLVSLQRSKNAAAGKAEEQTGSSKKKKQKSEK
jgi:hypothetical protein